MTNTCHCGQPAPNAWLCRSCDDQLEQYLVELPTLIEYLYDAVGGNVRYGSRVGGKSAETPMVINEAASKVAELVRSTLVRIIRGLIEDRGVSPLRMPVDELPDMARWLYRHIETIRTDQGAGEIYLDLGGATRAIVAIIKGPPIRKYAGKCSTEGVRGECPQELYAEDGDRFITCPRCGFVHQVDKRREVLRAAAMDTLLTIVEMRDALPEVLGVQVNERTLRTWKHRKRIMPHGLDWDGKELYRVGDIIDLVTNMDERAS